MDTFWQVWGCVETYDTLKLFFGGGGGVDIMAREWGGGGPKRWGWGGRCAAAGCSKLQPPPQGVLAPSLTILFLCAFVPILSVFYLSTLSMMFVPCQFLIHCVLVQENYSPKLEARQTFKTQPHLEYYYPTNITTTHSLTH